jgi:hypothetical protein
MASPFDQLRDELDLSVRSVTDNAFRLSTTDPQAPQKWLGFVEQETGALDQVTGAPTGSGLRSFFDQTVGRAIGATGRGALGTGRFAGEQAGDLVGGIGRSFGPAETQLAAELGQAVTESPAFQALDVAGRTGGSIAAENLAPLGGGIEQIANILTAPQTPQGVTEAANRQTQFGEFVENLARQREGASLLGTALLQPGRTAFDETEFDPIIRLLLEVGGDPLLLAAPSAIPLIGFGRAGTSAVTRRVANEAAEAAFRASRGPAEEATRRAAEQAARAADTTTLGVIPSRGTGSLDISPIGRADAAFDEPLEGLRFDPTTNTYNGDSLTRGDILVDDAGRQLQVERASGFTIEAQVLDDAGVVKPGEFVSFNVDDFPNNERFLNVRRTGRNAFDESPTSGQATLEGGVVPARTEQDIIDARTTQSGFDLTATGEDAPLRQVDDATRGAGDVVPRGQIEFVENFPLNETARTSMDAEVDDVAQQLLSNSGIRKIQVDPPYTFELSQQAGVSANGVVRVNPTVTNVRQSVLHEAGHVLWERASTAERAQLRGLVADNLALLRENSPGYVRQFESGDDVEAVAQIFAQIHELPEQARRDLLGFQPTGKSFDEAFPAIDHVEEARSIAPKTGSVDVIPVRSWDEIKSNSYSQITDQDDIAAIVRLHGDRMVVVKDINGGRSVLPASQAARLLDDPMGSGFVRQVFLPSGDIPLGPAIPDDHTLSYLPEFKQALERATAELPAAPAQQALTPPTTPATQADVAARAAGGAPPERVIGDTADEVALDIERQGEGLRDFERVQGVEDRANPEVNPIAAFTNILDRADRFPEEGLTARQAVRLKGAEAPTTGSGIGGRLTQKDWARVAKREFGVFFDEKTNRVDLGGFDQIREEIVKANPQRYNETDGIFNVLTDIEDAKAAQRELRGIRGTERSARLEDAAARREAREAAAGTGRPPEPEIPAAPPAEQAAPTQPQQVAPTGRRTSTGDLLPEDQAQGPIQQDRNAPANIAARESGPETPSEITRTSDEIQMSPETASEAEGRFSHKEHVAPGGPAEPPANRPPRANGQPDVDPSEFLADAEASRISGERLDQRLLINHVAAIEVAQKESRADIRVGNQLLKEANWGVRRANTRVPKSLEEMDAFYSALHNEGPVPDGLQEAYDLARLQTDFTEAMKLDFDPEMARVEDYMFRGWKPPQTLVDAGNTKTGGIAHAPDSTKARIGATYRQMRGLDPFEDGKFISEPFEPLFANPFEQIAYDQMQNVRYQQQMVLVEALKKAETAPGQELMKPWAGESMKGYRTPQIGLAFEGKPFAGETPTSDGPIPLWARKWVVRDEIANTLETLYGKKPDLGKISVDETVHINFPIVKQVARKISPKRVTTIGPDGKVLIRVKGTASLQDFVDWMVFVPKRAGLMLSFFQDIDFATRLGIGMTQSVLTQLAAGRPISALKTLGHFPLDLADIPRARFSAGRKQSLQELLNSTERIIPNRDVTFLDLSKRGLSIEDPTIFLPDMDAVARDAITETGLLGKVKGLGSQLRNFETDFRNGLFNGTYPSAITNDTKHNIAVALDIMYPTISDDEFASRLAKAMNTKFSTIPEVASVIQNKVARATLKRAAFSMAENEGLIRQFTGALKGPMKKWWATHFLSGVVFLTTTANIISLISTGKTLTARQYSPIWKTEYGPFPYGYNSQFASPLIPGVARNSLPVMLDLVGQMDTVFRMLLPKSFITGRLSRPLQVLTNQWNGSDFYDEPSNDFGPGGVADSAFQLLFDLFAPFGLGPLATGAVRRAFPETEGLIPLGEPRLGIQGEIIQAAGFNLRALNNEALRGLQEETTDEALKARIETELKEREREFRIKNLDRLSNDDLREFIANPKNSTVLKGNAQAELDSRDTSGFRQFQLLPFAERQKAELERLEKIRSGKLNLAP